MEAFVLVIIFAVLIQFLVDRIKTLFGQKIMTYISPVAWAVMLGILFAYMFDIDFFRILGLTSKIPIITYVMTGLIISAGAPAIHDLISKLRDTKTAGGNNK